MHSISAILLFFLLQEIPFKAKEDFDVKLDYQFKQRPVADHNDIHFDETIKERDRRTSSSMLPYLVVNVNLLKVSEAEVKVRVTNNQNRSAPLKKISIGSTIPVTLGFTDDVKDRVSPHEYLITFVSPDKKELSRIRIFVDEDGTFFVNDEKRGKF